MPEKAVNQAHSGNGTYEQIAPHLETVLELNSVVSPAEVQINAATQYATKPKPEGTKPTCQHCKKPGH